MFTIQIGQTAREGCQKADDCKLVYIS